MQQLFFFAPLHERFLAFLIDNIIMAFIGAICAVMMQITQHDVGPATLVSFLVGLFYYSYFHSGKWQASPGMRILGLRLAKLGKFRTIRPSDAAMRYIAMVMPVLPIYTSIIPRDFAMTLVFWLGMVWFGLAVFRPDRAAMHDLLSNMRVVRGKVEASHD